MQERETAVIVSNASYVYQQNEKKAVDDVSFKIQRGRFVSILGRNGSGKSTLAKLINGLYSASSGSVTVCGYDAANEDTIWELRSRCGMVFQNPDNQIVSTVVEEDVAFGLENMGVEPSVIRTRVDEALNMVGMSDKALLSPHMLSGGQKQRVAIAGVLAMHCDVLIFDEATAMLDPSGRKDVFDFVTKLNKEENLTIIWITHFMEEAVQSDYIYVMDEGKIVLKGTPSEVFSDTKRIRSYGLDVPVAAEFASVLRDNGVTIDKCVLTAEELMEAICQ